MSCFYLLEDFNRLHNLDSESGSREMNALLRLVLSMGNRRRDLDFIEDGSGDDTNDSSSSDDPESSIGGSDSSTNNENETETADLETKNNGANMNNSTEQESSSNNKDSLDSSKEIDSPANPSSSKLSDKSKDSNSNPTNRTSPDDSDSKRNKLDSGIVDDIAQNLVEYCSSSSYKSMSDQMDTYSSDDNSIDDQRPTDSDGLFYILYTYSILNCWVTYTLC